MPDAQASREFRRTFSQQAVASLAGRRSYERGLLYAENGRVRKLHAGGSSVEATVRGSSSYRVRLWVEDEEPAYESCPMGDGAGSASTWSRSLWSPLAGQPIRPMRSHR